MIYFPNKTISIYEYGESETEFNVYGEPVETYTKVGEYRGDFQPTNPSEVVEMEGTIYTDTYKLYLPLGTPITRTCKVEIDSENYSVIGSPQIYDHTYVGHIKVTLQRERK